MIKSNKQFDNTSEVNNFSSALSKRYVSNILRSLVKVYKNKYVDGIVLITNSESSIIR